MARRKIRPSVICPFYRNEEGQYVYCEGIYQGKTLRLELGEGAKKHLDEFCKKNWQACGVAQMLSKKEE